MTLEDRAKAIHTKLVDRGRKKLSIQLTQRLTEVKRRSELATVRLHCAYGMTAALVEDGVPIPSLDRRLLESAKKARTRLKSTATRLEASDLDEATTIQLLDGPTFQEALRDSDIIVDRLAGMIGKALSAERDQLLPKSIADPLPEVPGRASMVAGLGHRKDILGRDITVTASDFTAEGVAGLLAKRSERQGAVTFWEEEFPKLLEALEREPPEVQAFLRAAATSEGARLSLLTVDVRSRLEKDGLLDEFRIHRQ